MDIYDLLEELAEGSEIRLLAVHRSLAFLVKDVTALVKPGVVKTKFRVTLDQGTMLVDGVDREGEQALRKHFKGVTVAGSFLKVKTDTFKLPIMVLEIPSGFQQFPWDLFDADGTFIMSCIVSIYVKNAYMEFCISPSHLHFDRLYGVKCLSTLKMHQVYDFFNDLKYNNFIGLLEFKSPPTSFANTPPPVFDLMKPPTCSVCYEPTKTSLGCTHHLCMICKNHVARTNPVCPVCRKLFKTP